MAKIDPITIAFDIQLSQIDLTPDTLLVVRHPQQISNEGRHNLYESVKSWAERNRPELKNRIVVMDESIDLEAMPVESVRKLRDRLNEILYDFERGRG